MKWSHLSWILVLNKSHFIWFKNDFKVLKGVISFKFAESNGSINKQKHLHSQKLTMCIQMFSVNYYLLTLKNVHDLFIFRYTINECKEGGI